MSRPLNGKLVQGVLNLAKKFVIPVVAVCGQVNIDKVILEGMGIFDVIEIQKKKKPLSYKEKNVQELVEHAIKEFYKKIG